MTRTEETSRHQESNAEQYRVAFGSMPWDRPAAGVRQKIYERDGRRLRLAEFTQEFIEPDWCVNGHLGYVLEGRIEIDFNGNVVLLEAGDGLFIPAGEEHKHKARILTGRARVILVEEM